MLALGGLQVQEWVGGLGLVQVPLLVPLLVEEWGQALELQLELEWAVALGRVLAQQWVVVLED